MEWFMNNLSTIIISIIVFPGRTSCNAFTIAFLVYRVVKAKLSKQSMCSGCSGCDCSSAKTCNPAKHKHKDHV